MVSRNGIGAQAWLGNAVNQRQDIIQSAVFVKEIASMYQQIDLLRPRSPGEPARSSHVRGGPPPGNAYPTDAECSTPLSAGPPLSLSSRTDKPSQFARQMAHTEECVTSKRSAQSGHCPQTGPAAPRPVSISHSESAELGFDRRRHRAPFKLRSGFSVSFCTCSHSCP